MLNVYIHLFIPISIYIENSWSCEGFISVLEGEDISKYVAVASRNESIDNPFKPLIALLKS